ncbi:hypothetical protein A8709_15590 [Paenibacillus pectinilyticus]|uniref:ABC transporter substrate-binding protein n=1 Tax=Paenibacillus pectinilyticus TaxID=512399 RepID=A0A1C1A4K1_9BACL|nr:extracellular solute-binding protein [Paenibacillus pectinilyticus]OCT15497.1 hypothetical protein A8709_15590 [Paenibacillus pectinilyticus]
MKRKLMKASTVVVTGGLLLAATACGNSTSTDSSTSSPSASAGAAVNSPAATAKASTETVTYKLMTHYSNDSEKQPIDLAIAEVKKQFPNVTITPEAMANDNGEQLKTRIATGDLPDIVDINGQTMPNVVKSGSILTLDAFFAANPAYVGKLAQNIVDNQLKYTDGHIYAFPRSGPTVDVLFYNKKIFEQNGVKVPTNYPELLTAVKAFNAKGIVPITSFAKQAWPIGAFFDIFTMRANPEGMMALSKGTAKASDPGYTDAINKMAELIKEGLFQKGAVTADYDTARALFYSGKAAMLINGEWEIPDSVKNLGDDTVDFLDVFPVTDPGKEDQNKMALPGGFEMNGFAVSKNAKNSELAIQVAAAFTQAYQEVSFKTTGSTMTTIKTDGITPNQPLPKMAVKLLKVKGQYITKSQVEHSLPNQKFAASFGEELQKFVAGEPAALFISNTDKMIEKYKE